MIKVPALKRVPPAAVATPALAPPAAPSRRSKRAVIYAQLRNTTRRLVHPFVTALGWPSAATVYHRRRLLEATVIGLLLTEIMVVAILLLTWFAPTPPLVISLGAAPVSVVQPATASNASPAMLLTPTVPAAQPAALPSPTPGSYAVATPADVGVYLP